MEVAQVVLKREANQLDALLVMAELALETGNRDLASRLAASARRAAPNDPRTLGLLEEMAKPAHVAKLPARLLTSAHAALAAGDYAKAATCAQKALAQDSNLAGAHEVLGRALQRLGRQPESAAALAEAVRRDPQNEALKAALDEVTTRLASTAPSASPTGAGEPPKIVSASRGAATARRSLALAPITPKKITPKPVGRKLCVVFGGEVYDGPTALTVMLAPKFGADEVWIYDDNWIVNQRPDFHDLNRWLWEHHHKRGFGWYAWKPFILLDAMERMSDGDVVMYIDADTFPIDDFSVLYEICARDGGIMLFKAGGNVNNRFKQSQWCKRDCFVVMNQDSEQYYNAEAGVARFMLFQKGQWRAQQFLMEWLTYCVNPLATTFDPSVLGQPEVPGFVEHRTEQAIMTNLAHKYGLKLYREACELGNSFPEDKELYPQLFSQMNPWANKTAPCVGSKFRNVT